MRPFSLPLVCCLLFIVCCWSFVVWRFFIVVFCLLFVDRVLFVVVVGARCLSLMSVFDIGCLLFVVYVLLFAVH